MSSRPLGSPSSSEPPQGSGQRTRPRSQRRAGPPVRDEPPIRVIMLSFTGIRTEVWRLAVKDHSSGSARPGVVECASGRNDASWNSAGFDEARSAYEAPIDCAVVVTSVWEIRRGSRLWILHRHVRPCGPPGRRRGAALVHRASLQKVLIRGLEFTKVTCCKAPRLKVQRSGGQEGEVPAEGVVRGVELRYCPRNVRGLLRGRLYA